MGNTPQLSPEAKSALAGPFWGPWGDIVIFRGFSDRIGPKLCFYTPCSTGFSLGPKDPCINPPSEGVGAGAGAGWVFSDLRLFSIEGGFSFLVFAPPFRRGWDGWAKGGGTP